VLLCLRGTPIDVRYPSGFYYKDHFALGREFRAALGALTAAVGARVLPAAGVYAGFSQGAIMGAPMIVPHAALFPRLALIEGGYEYWSPKGARDFAKAGGKRVLFSCGTRWCKDKSEIPEQWLKKEGVQVRIEYASGAGHTPSGEVQARTAAALPWLFDGEPGWLTRAPSPR
jgi:predicted esterase